MKFYSTNKKAPKVSFKDAVIQGLAPDKGLYFPSEIKQLSKAFFDHIEYFSNHEIAYEVIKQFVEDEIPETDLKQLIEETTAAVDNRKELRKLLNNLIGNEEALNKMMEELKGYEALKLAPSSTPDS